MEAGRMEDDQQFCLRWNNHQSTLVSVFDTLLEKGIHVDCTLAAEGQTLRAHKVVLSACSPYFESVLSQQYDKHPIIILKDVKYAELRAMMDYMYRGEVNISQEQLGALLKAAESLQIKGLSDNKPPRHSAHPPRPTTPQTQTRDSSTESREGSASPTRRRKKVRRNSTSPAPPTLPVAVPPAVPAPVPVPVAPLPPKEETCKEEAPGVEDLTLDEEADPTQTPHDAVRNFQWHMERSQDDLISPGDGRDTQGQCALPPENEVSFTRIGGLSWEQWSARLALPLVAGMRAVGTNLSPAPGEPSFSCPDCGRVYKLKSSLRNHQKWECGKEPQFRCPYCVYRAKQKMHIARHMERMHREVHIKQEQFLKHDNVDACT